MAPRHADFEGRTFDRLTVTTEVVAMKTRSHRYWRCVCTCGNQRIVAQAHLLSGHTKSCGCLLLDFIQETKTIHGHARKRAWTTEYQIWQHIRRRCEKPTDPRYASYGGRGITVCARWQQFANFLKDVGPRPSTLYSIDRIDNDGNYEPGNVRWATWSQQRTNSRPRKWSTARRAKHEAKRHLQVP